MAYFRCSTGSASSGDGVALIVQCDASFAGSVITADNGEDIFTETCPSVSPYTVKFEGIPIGTYTISGIAEGQTFTSQFTVLDYETTLNATPEGATVLPINDIQIWLHCANIWDKNYTTISQVLADTTTLLALVSSNNAADYMARSTDWASSVCANQTAMGYIGNNDYCADTLLADATWRNAICNSVYFESVLNVKVPTMTSNTTPYGEAFANPAGAYGTYFAFNGTNSGAGDCWFGAYTANNTYIGYKFVNPTKVTRFFIENNSVREESIQGFKLQGSNDNSTWEDIGTYTNPAKTAGLRTYFDATNDAYYLYYRLNITSTYSTTSTQYICAGLIQFYGRT